MGNLESKLARNWSVLDSERSRGMVATGIGIGPDWIRWTRLQPYYLIIGTHDAQNSNGYDVTHIWKHYGQPARKLSWYDGREARARRILLQGCRDYKKDQIFYGLLVIIKEAFRGRQIQPCKSPYAGSSNWERGVTSRLTNVKCIGLLEEWSKESSTREVPTPHPDAIHLPSLIGAWMQKEKKETKFVWLKLKSQISKLLEILCS